MLRIRCVSISPRFEKRAHESKKTRIRVVVVAGQEAIYNFESSAKGDSTEFMSSRSQLCSAAGVHPDSFDVFAEEEPLVLYHWRRTSLGQWSGTDIEAERTAPRFIVAVFRQQMLREALFRRKRLDFTFRNWLIKHWKRFELSA